MNFLIRAIPLDDVAPLLRLDGEGLAAAGAVELRVDARHTFPCRVSLEDAEPGERVLLLTYAHQPADSPYRASGPIYVRRAARPARLAPGVVPDQQRRRLLSVRAYDARDWMVSAEVTEGGSLEGVIERMFAEPRVAYLHLHNARPGCYAARVDRT